MAIETCIATDVGFFDTSRALRWSLAALMFSGLFLFIHLREVSMPIVELGTPARTYVIAEVPFTYVDEESMVAIQHSAAADIGKIYVVDFIDFPKMRAACEDALLQDQVRRTLRTGSFDEMRRICKQIEQIIAGLKFVNHRLMLRLQQAELDTTYFHEMDVSPNVLQVTLPQSVWEFIRKSACAEAAATPDEVENIISLLKTRIWTLRSDHLTARRVRRQIQHAIPVQYMSVAAGTRIIDSGDIITARHITMMNALKKALTDQKEMWHYETIAGSAVLAGVLITLSWLFFQKFHPKAVSSNRELLLIVSLFLLGLCIAKGCETVFVTLPSIGLYFIHYPIIAPVIGILLCILVNGLVALFGTSMLCLMFAMWLSFHSEGFLLANFAVSLVTIFYTRALRRRSEIITVCLKGWVMACIVIAAMYLYGPSMQGTSILLDGVSAGLFMMITAIIVIGVLPIFEASFRVLTDINLVEYMNPNNELLCRLMMEAPGTYQHSLLMGSIAESAALAIGCNGLFCRVAALYHDIGKVLVAQYFAENQQGGVNLHQLLTPAESAKVIISHVEEGVMLARHAGLPEPFIDIIREHHGTSLAYYFYHKQFEAVGHDLTLIDEKLFRYAGPKPRTKEAMIIMIADSFEAACRSLSDIHEDLVVKQMDQIVREKMEDGQFDDCPLSFEELHIVKKAMVHCLLSISHFRIKYPTKLPQKA